MRNVISVVLMCGLIFGLALAGCGQAKQESSSAAINVAKGMETVEEKAQYLVGQAKAFYSSKEFQGAVDIAQYILRYVDRDSQEAKALLDKAKSALESAAKAAVGDAKKSFGF
ncbi:hypothetical protein ACFL0P_07715 [Candidatus Omnitrophota bacterium]